MRKWHVKIVLDEFNVLLYICMNAFQFPVQKNMINAVLILQLVYTSFALT